MATRCFSTIFWPNSNDPFAPIPQLVPSDLGSEQTNRAGIMIKHGLNSSLEQNFFSTFKTKKVVFCEEFETFLMALKWN
jgi:hypothetical protein